MHPFCYYYCNNLYTPYVSKSFIIITDEYKKLLLKKGSRGPAVHTVQYILNVHPQTGYFGPITETAVKSFQKKYGLKPDGIVGPRTWNALLDYSSKKNREIAKDNRRGEEEERHQRATEEALRREEEGRRAEENRRREEEEENKYHSLLPLPSDLNHYRDTTVTHPRVRHQKGLTCGSHATFNTTAIQQLLNDQEIPSAKKIRERSKTFTPHIKRFDYQLTYGDIIHLAQLLGLQNTHIVGYNRDRDVYYSAGAISAPQDLNQFFLTIRENPDILAHFIYNIGNSHWVAISIIKRRHHHTQIIYMDSLNNSVLENSEIHRFLRKVCQEITVTDSN